MIKGFTLRRLTLLFIAAGIINIHQNAIAGAFQLWEQDAATMGNYHAGRAAEALDSSTAYYNPAGLIRIKNQELLLGAAFQLPTTHFKGTVATNTLTNPNPQGVSVDGGGYQPIPQINYAAPISDSVVFGLSYVEPFGFKTDYGSSSVLRYASTLSALQVYDFAPSLAYAFNDKASVGFGINMQHLWGEFDHATTAVGQTRDTLSNNSGSDNAFGYNLGALYQFNDQTRVGISYHSQVVHRLLGNSTFIGPLAPGGAQQSNLRVKIVLPPTTSVSAFHAFKKLDVMGTVTYTQWSVTNNIILQNVTGMQGGIVTNTVTYPIAQNLHDSWNYSVGANYHMNDQWMIRTGIGYDKTPTRNSTRTIQLPDSNHIALALGTHYQLSDTIGVDAGWTHVFASSASINRSQTAGDQTVQTQGRVYENTDIYGVQVKWDML